MKNQIKVSYRKGKPLAAYLFFAQSGGRKSVRTEEPRPGILVDYSTKGEAIGLEITAPSTVTLKELNYVLSELGQEAMREEDLAPLKRTQPRDDNQALLFMYGHAASLAQELEKNLLVAFLASKKVSNERLSRADRMAVARDPSIRMIMMELCQHLIVSSSQKRLLDKSLRNRNYLFHSFIISKEHLGDSEHVRQTRQQLQDMIVTFRQANSVAIDFRSELLDMSGLSAKRIERRLREIKEDQLEEAVGQ